MPTYCTDAQVIRRLPTALPTDVDTEAERTAAGYRDEASRAAEEMVGAAFGLGTFGGVVQKFPDVTGTPATPQSIQRLTATIAASMLLDHIHFVNRAGLGGGDLLQDAAEQAELIRSGAVHVIDSAGTAYGGRSANVVRTTGDGVPVFTRGDYDEDGALLSDVAGSLDDL